MHVETLTRTDKSSAVDVLTSAFLEYPVMRFVLKDSGRSYEDHLRSLIGFFCESRFTRHWPFVGLRVEGHLVAAAMGNSPGITPRPPELRRVYQDLVKTIGPDAIQRLEEFEEKSNRGAPSGLFHYLGMIGVRPDWQGKKLARPLIDHFHQLADADPVSTGVCLSTEDPENVPLYEHLGYEVMAKTPVGGFTTWCMFRGKDH